MQESLYKSACSWERNLHPWEVRQARRWRLGQLAMFGDLSNLLMRHLRFLLSLALSVGVCLTAACDKDQCDQPSTPVAPAGYTIDRIGVIDPDEDVRYNLGAFQMVTATTGYVISSETVSDTILNDLYKTTDGGATWSSSPIPFAYPLGSLLFVDEATGYLAHGGGDDRRRLLRTADGGATWEDIAIATSAESLDDLRTDREGNLYAREGAYGMARLYKSTDKGLTWTDFYASDALYTANLMVADGRISFKESGGQIVILDLDGTVIRQASAPGDEQLLMIDADNIVVVDQRRMTKTSDGGATWTELFDDEAYVIDFSAEDGLITLLNRSFCGDDLDELSAFGVAPVSATDLEVSGEMRDFEASYISGVAKIGKGHFLLQRGLEIYALKRQ